MKGQPTAEPSAEPQLSLCLLEDLDRPEPQRVAGVGMVSVVTNALLLLGMSYLASVEGTPPPPSPNIVEVARKSTPLVFPKELTQKAPNKLQVAKEVHLEDLLPQPAVAPQRKVFSPPPSPQHSPAPQPSTAPAIEPPKIQVAQTTPPPSLGVPNIPAPPVPVQPQPQIQAQERPKLAFETPGGGASGPVTGQAGGLGKITPPRVSMDETIRRAARPGGGGMVVGDNTDDPGVGSTLGRSPTAGRQASQVELLSDPMGVDFRPYLIRVLTAVRRNWFAVIPESVHYGRQGRVVIQFAIAKNGGVPKLVIATPSGADALDRAAVAGISASNPFPPLPAEFKGDQIRVQLVFSYNAQTR